MKIVIIEPLGITKEKVNQAIEPLKVAGHDVVYYETRTEVEAELIDRSKDAEIIVVANQPLRENVMKHCTKLKMLSVAFTGFDHIDTDYCKENGIIVCNASGYSNNAVAELAFGFIISILRNIIPCDKACREGKTKAGLVGNEIYNKTFGIIGTGAIGGRVATIAKAFGCNVIAYNRSEKQHLKDIGVTYKSLEDVLKESDIISLHVPFNKETTKLISEKEISLMKETAILINTARGGVVDSEALAKALNEGKIAGAGIDVFEIEPPLKTDHPLLHSKNTVVAPHVAFATDEALFVRAKIVVDNILGYENDNIINRVA